MTELLGKPIREEVLALIKARMEKGQKIRGYVLVNPASFEASAYARLIEKTLDKLNLPYKEIKAETYEEAADAIKEANGDPLGSVFLCRPLKVEKEKELIESVSPDKDSDMLTSSNLGKLAKGDLHYLSGTSSSVNHLLDYYHIDVTGKKALIVGRSVSVGLPCALMLMKKNALIQVVHTKASEEDIHLLASQADILVLAAGKRGIITEKDLSPNQIIIDCGYQEDGHGDLGFTPDCVAFTPVPGGVGPITIALLAYNAFFLKYGE